MTNLLAKYQDILADFSPLNSVLRQLIQQQLQILVTQGFWPKIHIELEGTYEGHQSLNFSLMNQQLRQLGIAGQFVNEYWRNQWEYVSLFNGQTPLQEADYVYQLYQQLPRLFKSQGIEVVHIKPVVWHGDKGQLFHNSKQIFSSNQRSVHIPNAIQLNVSLCDEQGDNLVASCVLGEYIQQCLIETSAHCCILFLPEIDAFERLKLKSSYGLANELCSPCDLSGGHQGSIALYREKGKHNQAMGVETLLVDQHFQPLISHQNWQKTARIEHRLGASSWLYNIYFNIFFVLANIMDAIKYWQQQKNIDLTHVSQSLPDNLFDTEHGIGAVTLFEQSQWLDEHLATMLELAKLSNNYSATSIKNHFLTVIKKYNQK
jgi:hypothetical protein